MKKIVLTYVAGFMTATILTCGIAYASTTKTLQAEYNNIKVYIDNVLTDLKDANGSKVEPFICDGTTYLPVRGVAQALGCQVEWDGATQSVKLYKDALPDTAYLMEVCPPYEGGRVQYLQTKGQSFKMSNTDYTNGFMLQDYYDNHYTLFNLNGKYESLNLTVGHIDGSGMGDTKVSFIVDGKTIKEMDIIAEELPKNISIPVNYGLQMKILVTGYWDAHIGFGNITVK